MVELVLTALFWKSLLLNTCTARAIDLISTS